jgi:hypothetical protein
MLQCACHTVCICRHPELPEPPPPPLGFWGWVATVVGLGIATVALIDENVSLN